jgi:hypothetical protein
VSFLVFDEVFAVTEAGIAYRAYIYVVSLQVRAIPRERREIAWRFCTGYLLEVTSAAELLTALRATVFIRRPIIGLMSRLVLLRAR